MSSENGKGLSGPKTVGLAPDGSVWLELFGVLVKTVHVDFPVWGATLSIKVALEDLGPLGTGDVLVKVTKSLSAVHGGKVHLGSQLDVAGKLVPGLVVLMVKGTSFVLDNASEAVVVGSSGGSSNLCSITVTSNGSQSDLVLVHEADDVGSHVLHIVRVVMIRLTLVAVVKKPHVTNVEHLVVSLGEE